MTENRISFQIPQEDITEIQNAIKVLTDKLLPRLIPLSNEERKEMPKMGDKSIAFVKKSKEYAENNPALVPKYVDLEELKVDFQATETLVNAIDDTLMLSGSEAYMAALAFYNYVKGAAKSGVTGAQEAYDDLQARFPGRSRK